MRAPSYKGLRDDKAAIEVVREDATAASGRAGGDRPDAAGPTSPEALFDAVERLPDGALAVVADGRRLKLSNWDKVLFPETGFTKGDLIAYYARVAPAVLPHLRDRPLTLKRYPNGVDAPYFYEKQSPSHRPEWVQTARDRRRRLHAGPGPADAGLAGQPGRHRAAHLAVAGADARAPDDAGVRPRPRARRPGSSSAARWRWCCAACSSSSGWRAWSRPRAPRACRCTCRSTAEVTYEQTKPFARRIAELLEQRLPELVVSRMTKRLREGKVLVDWSQNDDHKTTVTVYSVRARERPTVSAPVSWEEVQTCRDARRPGTTDLRDRGGARTRGRATATCSRLLLVSRSCQRLRPCSRTRMMARDGSDQTPQPPAGRHRDVEGGDRRAAAADGAGRPRRSDPELRAEARRPAVGERHAGERAGDRRPHLGPGP